MSIQSRSSIRSAAISWKTGARKSIFQPTAWEISIKAGLGKLHLPGPPAQVIPAFMAKQGLRPLPVTHLHAVKVYDLLHHNDPFDRLIIAQAISEEMAVLSADIDFRKYPVKALSCVR